MNCSDSNRDVGLQMLSELREVITGTTSLVVYGFGVFSAVGPFIPLRGFGVFSAVRGCAPLRKEASVEDGP
jgi:hypothetical protein